MPLVFECFIYIYWAEMTKIIIIKMKNKKFDKMKSKKSKKINDELKNYPGAIEKDEFG